MVYNSTIELLTGVPVPPSSRSKGPVEGSLKMMPFKSSTICGIFSEPPIRDAI